MSDTTETPVAETATTKNGKKIGRPRKSDIQKPRKPGRPPGEKAAMDEFKRRLVHSQSSRKVVDKIVEAALDDEHKNQATAWKIITDRILPLSAFDPKKGGGAMPQISINIGTLGGDGVVVSSGEEDIEDAEYEEVTEE